MKGGGGQKGDLNINKRGGEEVWKMFSVKKMFYYYIEQN